MAPLFSTGFDFYSTGLLLQIWSGVGNSVIASGRWPTGQGLNIMANQQINKIWGTNESTLICGFAWIPTDPTVVATLHDILRFRDGTTVQMSLACTATGQLAVYRGGTGGTQLAATSVGYLTYNVWHYFEIKVVFATGATGSFEVRVDGNSSPILSGSSVITATTHAYANDIQFNAPNITNPALLDDIYLINTSGAVNNNFLGDVHIEARVPTGAGNYAQFTPSTGANWQNVDDIPPNGDTDYNSSATVGNIDSFAHQALSSLAGSIYWVNAWLYARKDDAGLRKVAPMFRISSTDYVGTDDVLSTSYQFFVQVYEQSPATSSAWTVSELNAAEIGYKLTA